MGFDELQLFVQLARAGSMTKAAQQMDISAAAVSAAIKRIEHELRVQLVERTTRSMRLTVEGERFLQTCESTLLAWTRGRASLQSSAKALDGIVRIAAPEDTALQFLNPWVAEFAESHAGLTVIVIAGDRMHDMAREAVDLAVRYGELEDSGLMSRMLVHSERVLVASPGYVKRHGAPSTPGELMQHRCLAWLRREQPNTHWSFLGQGGSTETVVVRPVLSGDSALVRAWALRGDGIAYKARIDVGEDLRTRRLVRLLPKFSGESVPVHAVLPSGRYLPARVRAFVEFLIERFRKLGAA